MAPIRLGPFELHDPIARGGTGEVWRATHATQGVPVAVKILLGHATDAGRSATRREVRAAAALDHPNIVRLFDLGEVDAVAASAASGALTPGAPWFAMELVDGTSAAPLRGRVDWSRIRTLLLAVLAALAHAHARGVIHRDLKPGNVLVGPRGAIKLTDFGIARQVGSFRDEREFMGTPAYMAPEQVDGHWRDHGPWTDLYAVGTLAWALATGRSPWQREDAIATLRAQQEGHLPPLPPTACAVPRGFREWLGSCMRPLPNDRFQRAADAAFALEQLGPPPRRTGAAPPAAAVGPDEDTPVMPPPEGEFATPTPPVTLFWEGAPAPALPGMGAGFVPRAGAPPPPPVPDTWRAGRPPEGAAALTGAGLALYGLRAIPVIGREPEQDALWAQLVAAGRGEPRVAVLRGAVGLGKSRLAEWLAERAHELGAASVLRAGHSPNGGPADGIGAMVARHLGCVGLDRDAIVERLRRGLGGPGDDEVQALAALIRPAGEAGVGGVRLEPAERLAVVRRLLVRASAQRPTVVWLDDAQWGAEALELATSALEGLPGLRVMFLVTAPDEPPDDPRVGALLDALEARPGAVVLRVEPLVPDARRALVRALLLLDAAAADQVADRTGGSPLFAVQLIGDWVARGLLAPSPSGFTLVGPVPPLPDDIHELWTARTDRVLAGLGHAAGPLLELAACLGLDVDPAEWSAAATAAGLAPQPELLDRLLTNRLARAAPDGAGWAFAHGLFRESLLRRAEEAGRLGAHHLACASALERVPGADGRLGRHLLDGGRPHEAVAPLARAGDTARELGEIREAGRLFALHAAALDAADVPADDPRWAWTWFQRAEIARLEGDAVLTRAFADRVLAGAGTPGWERAVLEARLVLAWLQLQRDLPAAVDALTDLLDDLRRADLPGPMVRALVVIGVGCQYLGDLDAARRWMREATALAPRLDLGDRTRGEAHRLRGSLALQEGSLDEADAQFQQALDAYRAAGNRPGQGLATSGLGDVARFREQPAAAEAHYVEALRLLDAVGAAASRTIRANLALVRIDRGRYAEARDLLDDVIASLDATDKALEQVLMRWVGLPCAAGLGDWAAFDAILDGARPPVDADVARALDRAGALAAGAAQVARARRAWSLAAAQWAALGRPDQADAAATRRDALETPTAE